MSARLIDGKAIAATIRREIAAEVRSLAEKGIVPGLGVVLVGEDPASRVYVGAKEKACAEVGMHSSDNRLPADAPEAEVLERVAALNADPRINGILVQLPLPKQVREAEVIRSIVPEKDVDGFHPISLGRLMLGEPGFLPCTPHGVVELLLRSGIPITGRHAVIVGRSNIVGKPLANMLMQKRDGGNATVTVCHTATPDLGIHTRQADIVVAAAGRPGTITGDMLKPGAAVIDVGINRVECPDAPRGYRLVGDVDFESAFRVAGWITPVPGGVGPMTIAMLLTNTLLSARRAHGI